LTGLFRFFFLPLLLFLSPLLFRHYTNSFLQQRFIMHGVLMSGAFWLVNMWWLAPESLGFTIFF
jgi:hypothetical protein